LPSPLGTHRASGGGFPEAVCGGATMATEADLTFCYSAMEDWVDLLLTLQELATRNDYEGFANRFEAFSRMPESETHRLRDLFEQTENYPMAAPTAFPPDLCGTRAACWSDVVAVVALAKLPHVISSAILALRDEYSRMRAEQERGRDVESIADMRMLWLLCRALLGHCLTWNGGTNPSTFVGLTEESFGPVRDQVSQVFSLIRQQHAPAVIALRRETGTCSSKSVGTGLFAASRPLVTSPLAWPIH
jgi:hypothetical protein